MSHFSAHALDYLETHLVDHCNLRCRGCSHFSPLAAPTCADRSVLLRDFDRLASLFQTISVIRLLGGEPLLHSEALAIMKDTRSCFPRSRICLVTNGLLLSQQSERFWECCKSNQIVIQVTKYPIRLDLGGALEAASRMGVEVEISRPVMTFVRFLNKRGDSDPDTVFRICRSRLKHPFLKDGRVFPCALSANAEILCSRFKLDCSRSPQDSISLSEVASGSDIVRFLGRPVPFCRWCLEHWKRFKWGISAMKREEWLGA